MRNALPRVALWAVTLVMLAATLASLPGAMAAPTPTYTLLGYVDQAGGPSPPPVPVGVTVDLISSATHQTYSTTTTSASGQFSFGSGNTGGTLAPGWWGLWVPPQAHVNLYGCMPCAVLPLSQNPQYYWENSTSLTTQSTSANPVTITGVTLSPYNATIWGNASYLGHPVAGATVELLAPTFNGFVLAQNTTVATATNTTVVGEYSLSVPWGTWVLETIVPGSPNHYRFIQVTVNASQMTVNPSVQDYLGWGFVNQASNPSAHVPAGGNVTVFDPTNGYIYSSPTPAGGFYSFGTYPAGFTGPGAQTLDVILSEVGWQTVSYPLTISGANHNGGANPKVVYTTPIAPPATYSTTLDFSKGFGLVNVSTHATLLNDSVFPELANGSVGQLWAQLALDWQSNLTFNAANLGGVLGWINSSGPFFPAGQDVLTVNGTGYGQPTNYTFANSTTCTTFCGLTSNDSLQLNWAQTYNATATIPVNSKTYAIDLNFRHPTNGEAFNYTVTLPSGYVLNAGSVAPSQSRLIPAGPNGTWTKFTLVSQPSTTPSSTASFTIVKYAAVTANVNVTTANFAYSSDNVLNQTHGNYTVIVGVGENATFSALNSTFPRGNNGTLYAWNFGDATPVVNTSQPTTYHTYGAAGKFSGSLTLTSSGGQLNAVAFTVYTDDEVPVASISTNATLNHTGSGAAYVVVNWSTLLHFNASNSTDQLNTGTSLPGIVSIATWNISTGTSTVTPANYSRGAGSDPFHNLTQAFLGVGPYLTNGDVNGTLVPLTGWQYNVTLQVWDSAGHRSTAYLAVLVKDTQKPTPVANLLDSRGRTVSSSGIVEGSGNHTAAVTFSATNTTDPHNGSVVTYSWNVTNSGNSTFAKLLFNQTSAGPSYKLPSPKPQYWLDPQAKPYTVNLTTTDRAGN
ncbi:MAG TPA: PKD domain-containing protein, partial [Thermoplasmata archaeon]